MSEELSHLKTLKDTFQEAYLQLLHQHPLNQISVKQIVLHAINNVIIFSPLCESESFTTFHS